MRWNKTITLLSPVRKWQDESGVWHEGDREPRVVFCNEYTIGVVAMANLRSSVIRAVSSSEPIDVGLRNERMVEVRAVDYQSEDQVIYEGDEYEVLYVSGSGETRLLTIGQRLGNDVQVSDDV